MVGNQPIGESSFFVSHLLPTVQAVFIWENCTLSHCATESLQNSFPDDCCAPNNMGGQEKI